MYNYNLEIQEGQYITAKAHFGTVVGRVIEVVPSESQVCYIKNYFGQVTAVLTRDVYEVWNSHPNFTTLESDYYLHL